jgi:hypothetical protein
LAWNSICEFFTWKPWFEFDAFTHFKVYNLDAFKHFSNEQTIEMQNKNKNKEWQKYSLLSNNDMKN